MWVRHDFTLLDTLHEYIKTDTVATEAALKRGQVEPPEICDRVQLEGLELFSLTFPTPGNRPTGKRSRNASRSSGCITKSPSGFFQSEAILARN